MTKLKRSRRAKSLEGAPSNTHSILVPAEPSAISYGEYGTPCVVSEAPVYCKPGRIFALGQAAPDSREIKRVVGRVFSPNEPIPAKPPEGATCGSVNPNGTTYVFTLSLEPSPGNPDRIVDRRVQEARIGPGNVLVTWVRFKGSAKWVRCLRDREFVGVEPPQ